ncbi:MAG TPA: aspartate kinase [Ignavibacteriaceae bacterium]|nr:aspartate kinase [Ignavibacteriaceae bacterium]
MKILKFGGTSVGTAVRMKEVAGLISGNDKKIIVLSAMAGTTNTLAEIAEELYAKENDKAADIIDKLENKYFAVVKELYSEKEYIEKGNEIVSIHFTYIKSFTQDLFTRYEERAVLAQGELLSTALFQLYLEEQEIKSIFLPALNFMRIDTNQEPDNFYIKENLERELSKYPDSNLFITQGYICRNLYGEIDNLKRGGSDYSASLIGAAIGADEIQIWTDISGMHNNDPRYVEKTSPVYRLTFDEAAELAYFGAKILHPSSILPAQLKSIPVRLKNTMQPDDEGTLISSESSGEGIKAIAAKDGITTVKIKSGRMLMAYGFLRRIFEVFERYRTPIDMITTSEVAVSLTIDDTTHLPKILDELKIYGSVEASGENSIVCLVGNNIVEQKGYIGKIFEALKHISVGMISYGGSRHSLSLLINSADKKEVLQSLHSSLFME